MLRPMSAPAPLGRARHIAAFAALRLGVGLLTGLCSGTTFAWAGAVSDGLLCAAAIARIEPESRLPHGLLTAIAINESGRVDPATGMPVPWPWSINVAGRERIAETKADAVAIVQTAQRIGIRSIDVGCMQINQFFHPRAFASLDEAFEPDANVRYAARFLNELRTRTGSWTAAVAAYHSETPELGIPYAERVAASWSGGGRFGLTVAGIEAALARAALEDEVDPNRVLTPEFRARQVAAAEARHAREAAATPPRSVPYVPARDATGRVDIAALEAEVDPKGVLTPMFRAQLVAAAALRHQQQAARLPGTDRPREASRQPDAPKTREASRRADPPVRSLQLGMAN